MKKIKELVPDTLLVFGAAILSYGAWLAWPPAGYITAGILSILGGIMAARS